MAISQTRVSLEEFLLRPEIKPALELIDGRVSQKVSPQGKHSGLQVHIVGLFNSFGLARKLARAFTELRATFAGSSLVPDVAVYRWERIPVDESGEVADRFLEPPDIAVEIISPEQSVRSQVDRCHWFIEHGVSVVLLVNPRDRSIIVFRESSTSAALHGSDVVDLGDVLPGFSFTPGQLFDSLSMR